MFVDIPDCKTWECINGFASWVSAFGTILISGLALWLAWKDRLVRISATFDYGVIPGDSPTVLNREVYVLAFTNIGYRTVTVTNYEWRIPNWPVIWRKVRVITFPQLEPELGNVCSKFPVELTDGKEGHIFHKRSFFEDLEDRENLLFSSSYRIALLRIFSFKMIISTTTGKRANVNIPFRVRRNIWNRYLKVKSLQSKTII